MLWTYETEVGVFWIKPDYEGKFLLGVNEYILGRFVNPVSAADNVYLCKSGYKPWDNQLFVDNPTDIYEWNFYKK